MRRDPKTLEHGRTGPGSDDFQHAVLVSVSRAADYRRALAALLRRVAQAGGWEYAEAWVPSRDRSVLKPGPVWPRSKACFSEFQKRRLKLGFRRGSGLPGRVLRSGEPDWVEQLASDPSHPVGRHDAAVRAGFETALATPVVSADRVQAVLVFFSREAIRIDAGGVRAARELLAPLGPLLERKKIEEELRVRARQQESVATLGLTALKKSSDPDALTQQAIGLVARVLDVENVEILEMQPEPDDARLRVRASAGWGAEDAGRLLPADADTLASRALEALEPVSVEDFEREAPQPQGLPSRLAERDLTSGLCVLIHGLHQPLGVLGAYTTRRRRFSHNDTSFLQGVANVLGTALERQRVELALDEERRFVTTVLDNVGAIVIVLDEVGRPVRVNRGFLEICGYDADDARGKTLWSLLEPSGDDGSLRPAFEATLAARDARHCECECRSKSGKTRHIAWSLTAFRRDGVPTPYVIVAGVDMTERRQAEMELEESRRHLERLVVQRTAKLEATHEKLRQAERLASLGTLAAGLAHDMDNVLLPALCRLDALERLPLPGTAADEVWAIRRSLDYLRKLSRGLRHFTHDPDDRDASDARTDLAEWWREAGPLIEKAVPEHVEFRCELPPDLPDVAVPDHRLTQAILNLVVNAGEAADRGGVIRLDAETQEDGKTVRFVVEDDGPGMSEEVARHALEPFFTTKTRRLSTGLGLSLVHGVAQSSGGTVEFDTRPGHGTRVLLGLPTLEQPGRPARGGTCKEPDPCVVVSLEDERTSAFVSTLLRSAGVDVVLLPSGRHPHGRYWVTSPQCADAAAMQRFLDDSPGRRVVLLGGESPTEEPRVRCVQDAADMESLCRVLRETVHGPAETEDEADAG